LTKNNKYNKNIPLARIIHEFLYSAVIPAKGRHPLRKQGQESKKKQNE
jgi:hypothetical protein